VKSIVRIATIAALLISGYPIASPKGVGTQNAVDALGKPTIIRPDDPTRPIGVPDGYVVTPVGYFHPSCVTQIEPDEEVDESGLVRSSSGLTRSLPECKYPHFVTSGSMSEEAAPDSLNSTYNGWISSANVTVSMTNAAHYLLGHMIVPPNPTVVSGQIIALFTGLYTTGNSNAAILQPVLAWNGYNDNTWTVAGWNCCVGGVSLYSPPVRVMPGEQIFAEMYPANCAPGVSVCPSWIIHIEKYVGSNYTQLTYWQTTSHNQAFNEIYGVVLETYGITQCQQFPPSPASFYGVGFTLAATPRFYEQNVNWGFSGYANTAPPCGYVIDSTHPDSISTNFVQHY
jgi:hypothetical protein